MLTQLIVALLAAVILGVALLLWGLRGRRINDHPTCRQCRFDLAGQPTPLITCPECGCGLKRPGWVVMGLRRRRPIAITLGVLLVTLPVITLCSTMLAVAAGVDLHAHKPTGLLIFETRHGSPRLASSAAAELLARTTAGKLKGDPLTRAIDAALDIQADQTRPFPRELGDIIEQAKTTGSLSQEQADRFLRQHMEFEWLTRPRVAKGSQLPVIMRIKDVRMGGQSAIMSMAWVERASVNDQIVVKPPGRADVATQFLRSLTGHPSSTSRQHAGHFTVTGNLTRFGTGMRFGEAKLLMPIPRDLPPGRHRASVTFRVISANQAFNGTFTWPSADAPSPTSTDVTHEFEFELLPDGQTDVELIEATPQMQRELELALQPMNAAIYKYSTGTHDQSAAMMQVSMNFGVENVPIGVAFAVTLRQGDQKVDLGSIASAPSALPGYVWSYPGIGFQQPISVNRGTVGLKPGRVDVILRPSLSTARSTASLTRIYNGELTFRDVELIEPLPFMNTTRPQPRAARNTAEGADDSKPSDTQPPKEPESEATPEKP